MYNRDLGFSFIEVMVAMVILSISLVILLDSQGNSMALVGRAHSLNYATTLASGKISELVQLAEKEGIQSLQDEKAGEFDQEKYPGYHWRYRVMEIVPPDFAALMKSFSGSEEEKEDSASNAELLAGPLKQIQDIWGKAIRELRLEIFWTEGLRERNYELVTHLIAPEAIGQVQGMVGALGGQAK